MKDSIIKVLLLFNITTFIFPQNCEEENLKIYCDYDIDDNIKGRNANCELFEQFASNNEATNDWRESINQRLDMICCKCYKKDLEKQLKIYEYLGRSYAEEGILDSAVWAFKEGIKKDNNKLLIELVAWALGKQIKKGDKSKIEEQIYYLETLLEFDSEDIKILERMSNIYKNNGFFEEQIEVLNRWIKIDPSNTKAISDKRDAYNNLGKDVSEVDKERWEKEPTNLVYGISYIESLQKKSNYEKSIEICEELLVFYSESKRLLKLTAQSHIENFDDNKAVKIYLQLNDLDPTDTKVMLELSKLYVNLEEFDKAYLWSDNAVKSGNLRGKAYFQRAEVLKQLVDYYRSDDLDFCDQLIYDLATIDYQFAYDNRQLNAKIYKNHLKELVTTVGDWFLLGDKFDKFSPGSKECEIRKKSDCYKFINREVTAK